MILLYGAGGGPGRGEIPMDLIANRHLMIPNAGCQGQIAKKNNRRSENWSNVK